MIDRLLRRFPLRGPLGCAVIVLGLLLCTAATTFALDRVCYASLSQRLPLYPNAQITYRQHNLFTELGMGVTVIMLDSPDEPDVVRSWYGRAQGAYNRAALESGDVVQQAGQRLSRADWSVTRAEDGTGSQIILFGTCVN